MPMFVSGSTRFFQTKKGSIVFTSPVHTGMLSFGVSHLDYSYSVPNFVKIQGKLVLHGNGLHCFGPGGTLTVRSTGVLEIGNSFSVGHFHRFVIGGHSVIGDNNMHSWNNLYMDTDSHPILDETGTQINENKGFVIGDKVWMGAKCTVLKGAAIASGCVIATGSLINKRLETPKTVYAGNRMLKENITWKSEIL